MGLPVQHGHLPRLSSAHYANTSFVHWVHTVDERRTGWLTATSHQRVRELLLHALWRYGLVCPAYCLMPEHLHLVWCGVARDADQKKAAAFLRKHLNRVMQPFRLQRQSYDHVLRDKDRERDAFASVCAYVLANPVRKALVSTPEEYPYSGCMVPGYPELTPVADDYWIHFWRIYAHLREDRGTA